MAALITVASGYAAAAAADELSDQATANDEIPIDHRWPFYVPRDEHRGDGQPAPAEEVATTPLITIDEFVTVGELPDTPLPAPQPQEEQPPPPAEDPPQR